MHVWISSSLHSKNRKSSHVGWKLEKKSYKPTKWRSIFYVDPIELPTLFKWDGQSQNSCGTSIASVILMGTSNKHESFFHNTIIWSTNFHYTVQEVINCVCLVSVVFTRFKKQPKKNEYFYFFHILSWKHSWRSFRRYDGAKKQLLITRMKKGWNTT